MPRNEELRKCLIYLCFLDLRCPGFEPEGRGFESLPARQCGNLRLLPTTAACSPAPCCKRIVKPPKMAVAPHPLWVGSAWVHIGRGLTAVLKLEPTRSDVLHHLGLAYLLPLRMNAQAT